VRVREDRRGWPVAVVLDRRPRRVVQVHEVWELDTEWWRPQPTSRRYYRITVEGERSMTIFRDLTDGDWYRQQT
jgi:hypothetical protein